MDTTDPPPNKRGWLRKQGRNLFKNWKKRYFTVELGLVSYFENEAEDPPYGKSLKGQMSLRGASLEDYYDSSGNRDDKKVYVVAGEVGENDLLVEATNAFDARQWSICFDQHITFANNNPDWVLHKVGDQRESENDAIRASTAAGDGSVSQPSPSPVSLAKAWNAEAIISARSSEALVPSKSASFEPIELVPKPCFVVKIRKDSGTKVFINVGEHASVPPSDKKRPNKLWPLIVAGRERISIDRSGENCEVIDVIMNGSVFEEINKDDTGECKDEVILKILDLLQQRDPQLTDKSYSCPKISKSYKGDQIATTLMSASDLAPYGKKFLAPKTDAPGGDVGDAKGAGVQVNRRDRLFWCFRLACLTLSVAGERVVRHASPGRLQAIIQRRRGESDEAPELNGKRRESCDSPSGLLCMLFRELF
jgi:hypothetical protein